MLLDKNYYCFTHIVHNYWLKVGPQAMKKCYLWPLLHINLKKKDPVKLYRDKTNNDVTCMLQLFRGHR